MCADPMSALHSCNVRRPYVFLEEGTAHAQSEVLRSGTLGTLPNRIDMHIEGAMPVRL